MSKTTTYFWKICQKSHGKRGIVSLVSNKSLFFACHVSLLFNTQGSFVSKLQPIKTSHFWQGAWGRIGISEGFYFWVHEGASDVNGLILYLMFNISKMTIYSIKNNFILWNINSMNLITKITKMYQIILDVTKVCQEYLFYVSLCLHFGLKGWLLWQN